MEDRGEDPDPEQQPDELEPEAELVALRLAAGGSHAEAALEIGRSAKWVQRRLASDHMFQQRVEQLKRARVEQASAGLGALLERAVRVVERNLDARRPADQLQAARLIFDRSRLFRADAEMAEQVEILKEQLDQLHSKLEDMGSTPQRSQQ